MLELIIEMIQGLCPGRSVLPQSNLKSDLEMDSLCLVELFFSLEEKLALEIEPAELLYEKRVETVADLAKRLEECVETHYSAL